MADLPGKRIAPAPRMIMFSRQNFAGHNGVARAIRNHLQRGARTPAVEYTAQLRRIRRVPVPALKTRGRVAPLWLVAIVVEWLVGAQARYASGAERSGIIRGGKG